MTRHIDQLATEPAATILKIAAGYSGDELAAALDAACRAIEYSLEEAGVDAAAGRLLTEALAAAGEISHSRA